MIIILENMVGSEGERYRWRHPCFDPLPGASRSDKLSRELKQSLLTGCEN